MDQMLRSLNIKVFSFEFEFLFFFLLFVFSSSSSFFDPFCPAFLLLFLCPGCQWVQRQFSVFSSSFFFVFSSSCIHDPPHTDMDYRVFNVRIMRSLCMRSSSLYIYIYIHTWGILIYCLSRRTFFVFVESAENLTPERWPTLMQDSF